MHSGSSVTSRYLEHYAESEVQSLRDFRFSKTSFGAGIAIPLRGESFSETNSLLFSLDSASLINPYPVLVIAVINGSASDSEELKNNNVQVLSRALRQSSLKTPLFCFEHFSPNTKILWVNRFCDFPFGDKDGVGLARKIGCDLLLELISTGQLRTDWIWTSDADARLPEDYFVPQSPPEQSVALHYRYRHSKSSFVGAQALTLYEIHLRYYYLGLRFAFSPFAYPSIGSCLAVRPDSYAAVRGFPKRQAGEDFHFLNKLRKVGPIHYHLHGNPLCLAGRFSRRVPFGTGQATFNIHEQLSKGAPFSLYHPKCFEALRTLLSETHRYITHPEGSVESFSSRLSSSFFSKPIPLDLLHFSTILSDSLSRSDTSNRLRHFATAFDAVKTLRFIHLLNSLLPTLSWIEALTSAPFLGLKNEKVNLARSEEILCLLQDQEEDQGGSSPQLIFF